MNALLTFFLTVALMFEVLALEEVKVPAVQKALETEIKIPEAVKAPEAVKPQVIRIVAEDTVKERLSLLEKAYQEFLKELKKASADKNKADTSINELTKKLISINGGIIELKELLKPSEPVA